MSRMYISGPPAGSFDYMDEELSRCDYRLFSIHGNYLKMVVNWADNVPKFRKLPKEILLDSGAFTAWNKGHKTTLEEVSYAYDEVLSRILPHFENVWCINLDVIPGTPAARPTPEEAQEAVEESDVNYRLLTERFGSRIIPVYHRGESIERLAEVQAQNKYICLSPTRLGSEQTRIDWCREMLSKCNGNDVHGLAATGRIMLTLPWYSVDSATPIQNAAFGILVIVVNDALKKVFVSTKYEKHKDLNHLLRMPKAEQDIYLKVISEDIFTLEELIEDSRKRNLFNTLQLTKFMRTVDVDPTYQMTLF